MRFGDRETDFPFCTFLSNYCYVPINHVSYKGTTISKGDTLMEITEELRAFLWMLLTRLIHQEEMMKQLLGSDKLPTELSTEIKSNPVFARYASLDPIVKDGLMARADKILDLYGVTVAKEPITEENLPISFFGAKMVIPEQKTEEFEGFNKETVRLVEKQAV